nr:MAG TPA: hypothetical protein [Bacteriophage sp.]
MISNEFDNLQSMERAITSLHYFFVYMIIIY